MKLRRLLEELWDHGDGAIEIDSSARGLFARRFATYLDAYRMFGRVLQDLERRHRRGLGYPEDGPVKLNGAVFPIAKTLCKFERIIGHSAIASAPASPLLETLVLRNDEHTVPI